MTDTVHNRLEAFSEVDVVWFLLKIKVAHIVEQRAELFFDSVNLRFLLGKSLQSSSPLILTFYSLTIDC